MLFFPFFFFFAEEKMREIKYEKDNKNNSNISVGLFVLCLRARVVFRSGGSCLHVGRINLVYLPEYVLSCISFFCFALSKVKGQF